jgi:Glycosyl hydrolase family 26
VNATEVAAWEAWLGRPAYRVLDFLARENWDKIAAPTWWVDNWGRSAYASRVVYSVPMLPDTPSSLAQGATGAYDAHFERLARLLVSRGQGGATIRLGWEFNGDWYRWNAAQDAGAFVAYWRRIVDAMRRQPGAAFKFDWCPNLGRGTIAPDRVYPGDGYVDVVGADVYDHGWMPGYQDPAKRWEELMNQPYGLRWQRDFARAHGKPVSFPEWGLVLHAGGHGGGDNPSFVQRMYEWIAANDVAYHSYFEVDMPGVPIRLMTGRFPNAAAEFKRLFGPPPTALPGTPGARAGKVERPTARKRRPEAKRNRARHGIPTKRKAKAKRKARTKRRAAARRKAAARHRRIAKRKRNAKGGRHKRPPRHRP